MNSEPKLNVLGISRIRTDTDGEGVTTLVVSMGCPLRCAYCINPATWDGSYDKFVPMTADELFNRLKIDNIYFLATGGGIVFGGGEPLLNVDFLEHFFKKYKKTGWKFSLETSLSVPRENLERIYKNIDLFFVDSKDMNKERYELYTKGNYDLFLSNLLFLKEHVEPEKIIVRVPKIYEFHKGNEAEENIQALKDLGIENINVFEYIDPERQKEISDAAKNNRDSFLEKIRNK